MKYFTILMLFVAQSVAVKGQQPLSLAEAIENGLNKNYGVQIEKENVQIAKNNNSWGQAGALPTVSLNVNQNNSLSDNVKTASPFQLQDVVISNSINPNVSLNWQLFGGLKAHMNKQRFDQLQKESEGNASIVVSNTIQSIILAYYAAVYEQERLTEVTKQMELSRDRLRYTQTKAEIGSANTTDLLLVEGNYLTDSIGYINQKMTIRNAYRTLNVLMNEVDPDQTWILTDALDYAVPEYNLETLQNRLVSDNLDLQKQYLTQAILKTELQTAKRDRYPTLQFSAGVGKNWSSVDLSNASFPNSEGGSNPGPSDRLNALTDNVFANLTLSYRLFDGGRIKRAVRNAALREDIGRMRTEQLKQSLSKDLAQMYDLYEVRKRLYDINVRREEVAKINLSISDEKFKQGTISSIDYRVIQNNYLSAAFLRLDAKYLLIIASVNIARLTDGLFENMTSKE